jgi:rfaE bifunctional protein kinase chain/domain
MNRHRLHALLSRFGSVRIAVVGDFFLDHYLVTDPTLSEPSLETGLEARQVVAQRVSPGHAGTVTNNLRALDVQRIYAVGFTGDDGGGYELRRCLALSGVDVTHLALAPDVATGIYMKPTARHLDGSEAELERLDVKNRAPLPGVVEDAIIHSLRTLVEPAAAQVDAIVVADQVEERNHGAITDRVREVVCELAQAHPHLVWYADSRRRIGEYHGLLLKPNRDECYRALGAPDEADAESCAVELAGRAGRTVFLTLAAEGILVAEPDGHTAQVPALLAAGPIDTTGAGDSATAGIVPALVLGASAVEAAQVGQLVAGITIRQVGTTGTATPEQVLAAFDEAAQ